MNNPLLPKKRRRRSDSKYRPKFARELRNGLRENGMSEAEVCKHFGISKDNYRQWKKSIPAFAKAVEIGDIDFEAFWDREFREVATGQKEGNAGCMKVAVAHFNNYITDKTQSNVNIDEEIRIIEITQIEAPKINIIEHQEIQQIEYASESTSSTNPKSD